MEMTQNNPMKLIVDNREIEAEEGETLLQACLENGIYIPNLCYIKGMEKPPGSCRLCFVEIDGRSEPITSCTLKVMDGMNVKTDTPRVRRLQRSALRLFLSTHRVDCGKCPANKRCELQKLARFLKVGLNSGQLEKKLKELEVDETHPYLNYYPNRCVLCGKCLYVCGKGNNRPFLTFAQRGLDTVISFYGENDIAKLPCGECHACADVCPVSAITLKP